MLLIAHRALWPDANVFFSLWICELGCITYHFDDVDRKIEKIGSWTLAKKNRERNFLISIINKRVSRWFNQRLSRTMVLLQLEVMFIRNKKKKQQQQ